MATVLSGSVVVVTEREGKPGATVQIHASGILSDRLSIRTAIDLRNALSQALTAHANAKLLNAIHDNG